MSIATIASTIKERLAQGDEAAVSQLLLPYADSVDAEVVTHLLRLMVDDRDVEDTMWGFIHMMETCNPQILDQVIISELPLLYRNAPRWARMVVGRAVSSSYSDGRGFDATDFLQAIRDQGSSECKKVFAEITAGWPNVPSVE